MTKIPKDFLSLAYYVFCIFFVVSVSGDFYITCNCSLVAIINNVYVTIEAEINSLYVAIITRIVCRVIEMCKIH